MTRDVDPDAVPDAAPAAAPDAAPDDQPGTTSPEPPLAPIDFSTFVLSLGSTAMVNLGEVPAPGMERTTKDLPAAKQMIDILGILQEKTKGNLTEPEQHLIDSLLYDLRVKWVDAQPQPTR